MEVIIYIALLIGVVLLTRLFGAWMLRIDEVIKLLKDIKSQNEVRNLKDDLK